MISNPQGCWGIDKFIYLNCLKEHLPHSKHSVNVSYYYLPPCLRLKLQYFGHLMQEKTLMMGGIGGRRRREQQRMKWLDGITDSMDMNLSKLQETVKDREACHGPVHGVTKNGSVTEQQQQPMSWSVPGILHLKSLYFVLSRVEIFDIFQGRRWKVSQRRYFIPFVTELYFIICIYESSW